MVTSEHQLLPGNLTDEGNWKNRAYIEYDSEVAVRLPS